MVKKRKRKYKRPTDDMRQIGTTVLGAGTVGMMTPLLTDRSPTALGNATQGMVGMINSFAITDGELYVRQIFDGIPAGNPAFIHRYTMGDEVFPCSEIFTGLDDEENVSLSIFPNPTTSHLTLTGTTLQPGTHIIAYSLTGQQVFARHLHQAHEQLTLDARQFGPAGMYLLHVQTPGQTAVVKKVVLQE